MNETKGQKVKAWFKKHWWVPVTVVIGTATVIIIRKKFGVDVKKYVRHLDLSDLEGSDTAKAIFESVDEDIFTDLAIKIEEAVLDPGIDHLTLTRAYDLGIGSKLVTVEIGKQ